MTNSLIPFTSINNTMQSQCVCYYPVTVCINLCNKSASTLNYLGFLTLSIVRHSKKLKDTMFLKLDVSVVRRGGRTPTLLGPLERPNLNHWTT
jgi:hypothetical protein